MVTLAHNMGRTGDQGKTPTARIPMNARFGYL
jgi:hypothetical protein